MAHFIASTIGVLAIACFIVSVASGFAWWGWRWLPIVVFVVAGTIAGNTSYE